MRLVGNQIIGIDTSYRISCNFCIEAHGLFVLIYTLLVLFIIYFQHVGTPFDQRDGNRICWMLGICVALFKRAVAHRKLQSNVQ